MEFIRRLSPADACEMQSGSRFCSRADLWRYEKKKNAQGFIPKQEIGLQKFVSQVTSHRYAEAQVLLCCQGESCGSAHAQVIGG